MIPITQQPARVGVYLVHYNHEGERREGYAYWTGNYWTIPADTPDRAHELNHYPSGLLADPNADVQWDGRRCPFGCDRECLLPMTDQCAQRAEVTT